MELLVERNLSDDECTLGKLSVNEDFECYTLEPVVREQMGIPVKNWKIPGKTAIPAGSYDVIIDYSEHFGRNMPHVLNVPGFDGVRIHSGNTAADTEGCLLLGEGEGKDAILNSHAAFDRFFNKLQDAIANGEKVTITYQNP